MDNDWPSSHYQALVIENTKSWLSPNTFFTAVGWICFSWVHAFWISRNGTSICLLGQIRYKDEWKMSSKKDSNTNTESRLSPGTFWAMVQFWSTGELRGAQPQQQLRSSMVEHHACLWVILTWRRRFKSCCGCKLFVAYESEHVRETKNVNITTNK